jgi:hypothetical protein
MAGLPSAARREAIPVSADRFLARAFGGGRFHGGP